MLLEDGGLCSKKIFVTAADLENASRDELVTRLVEAERQLAWLKKQLFGTKSEKRYGGDIVDVAQLSLGEAVAGERRPVAKTVTVQGHARQLRKTDEPKEEPAVRFDDTVPRTERVLLPPEVEGLDESEYEIIGEKRTQRLVQTPSTYQIEGVCTRR